MYPSDFYKKKNFANPKTMFKSCTNNEEFSTEPITRHGNRLVFARGMSATSSSSPHSGRGNNGRNALRSINRAAKKITAVGALSGGHTATDTKLSDDSDLGETSTPNTSEVYSSQFGELSTIGSAITEDDSNQYTTGDEENASSDSQADTPEHHPLNSTWTLWYFENERNKSWEEMLHEVTSFNTVESFWSLINHIKPPSEIKLGSDYCIFKNGIRPMWEDTANKKGGRWVINLSKSSKNDLDNFWLDTMLCLIGECCEHSNELCGAVVNIRPKSNKISIWTSDGNNEAAAIEIGQKLRESLRLDNSYVLQYLLHKDSMAKQSSSVKSIYTI